MNGSVTFADESLLPAILVLNKKYYPSDGRGQVAFSVGATSFALEVANFFLEHDLLQGYLFYQRDEALSHPEVLAGEGHVTVRFHFRMSEEDVRSALYESIRLLTGAPSGSPPKVMVYYQTDTLLQYHPVTVPHCVTHHGPFVDAFSACYSYGEACRAFESPEKARHLQIQQQNGIRALAESGAFVLTHSSVQRRWLTGCGVGERRIASIVPPVFRKRPASNAKLPIGIADFISSVGEETVLLVSAVARLDYFKDVEMLVEAALVLLQDGRDIRVLIAGDGEDDPWRRVALRASIPEVYRGAFLILPRVAHHTLIALFDAICGRAVFVFTSRYETLGITPLEAVLQGVLTLMPALSQVEASAYFPPRYRYVWSVAGLTDRLTQVLDGAEHRDGHLTELMRRKLNPMCFNDNMMEAWRLMSDHFLPTMSIVN